MVNCCCKSIQIKCEKKSYTLFWSSQNSKYINKINWNNEKPRQIAKHENFKSHKRWHGRGLPSVARRWQYLSLSALVTYPAVIWLNILANILPVRVYLSLLTKKPHDNESNSMLFIQLIHSRFRILFSMVKIGFEIKLFIYFEFIYRWQ